MAVSPVFEAIISAVDRASGPLRAIMAAFGGMAGEAEHAGHAAHRAGAKIEHAGHAAHRAGAKIEHAGHHAAPYGRLTEHVTLLRSRFGELGATVGEAGHSLTEFLPALGAIGAAGSAIGLVELVEHVSEAQSELQKSAKEIGISANDLQAFNYAAQQTDVSAQSADYALVKLNRSVADAASGKSKDSARLFHHLGISLKDSSGHLKTVSQLLPALAEAFQRTADPAQRTQMAMQLFGRSGAELLPLLMEGSDGLREFADQSERLQYTFSDSDREHLEGYHRSILNLQTAVGGFSSELGAKLAPVLQPIVDTTTAWVAANRDWIATGIAAAVKSVGDVLTAQLPLLHGYVDAVKGWINTAASWLDTIGGVKVAFLGIVAVIGAPFLGAALAAGVAIKTNLIGPALEAPKALYTFATALNATRDAEFALNFAFVTNPFGVVLAGVALLGAAAYELIEHWKAVKTFFTALWNDIAAVFDAGWQKIKPIVDAVAAAADSLGLVHHVAQPGMAPTGGHGLPHFSQSAIPSPSLAPQSGALPSVISPLGDRASAAPGRVDVHVKFDNLPPGARVSAVGSGGAQPHVDTGVNHPDGDVAAYADTHPGF